MREYTQTELNEIASAIGIIVGIAENFTPDNIAESILANLTEFADLAIEVGNAFEKYPEVFDDHENLTKIIKGVSGSR